MFDREILITRLLTQLDHYAHSCGAGPNGFQKGNTCHKLRKGGGGGSSPGAKARAIILKRRTPTEKAVSRAHARAIEAKETADRAKTSRGRLDDESQGHIERTERRAKNETEIADRASRAAGLPDPSQRSAKPTKPEPRKTKPVPEEPDAGEMPGKRPPSKPSAPDAHGEKGKPEARKTKPVPGDEESQSFPEKRKATKASPPEKGKGKDSPKDSKTEVKKTSPKEVPQLPRGAARPSEGSKSKAKASASSEPKPETPTPPPAKPAKDRSPEARRKRILNKIMAAHAAKEKNPTDAAAAKAVDRNRGRDVQASRMGVPGEKGYFSKLKDLREKRAAAGKASPNVPAATSPQAKVGPPASSGVPASPSVARPNPGSGAGGHAPVSSKASPVTPSHIHNYLHELAKGGTNNGMIPIHALRSMVAKNHGPEAASHATLDPILKDMRANGHFRMAANSDNRDFTDQQLSDSVPGLNETQAWIHSHRSPSSPAGPGVDSPGSPQSAPQSPAPGVGGHARREAQNQPQVPASKPKLTARQKKAVNLHKSYQKANYKAAEAKKVVDAIHADDDRAHDQARAYLKSKGVDTSLGRNQAQILHVANGFYRTTPEERTEARRALANAENRANTIYHQKKEFENSLPGPQESYTGPLPAHTREMRRSVLGGNKKSFAPGFHRFKHKEGDALPMYRPGSNKDYGTTGPRGMY